MSSTHANTPANPWGIKVPAATHGARQIPIPQPATVGEARSPAFKEKLLAANSAQNAANLAARAEARAREDARPYQPDGVRRPTGSPPRTPPVRAAVAPKVPGMAAAAPVPMKETARDPVKSQWNTEYDQAAAQARALLSGEAIAQPNLAGPAPAARDQDVERSRGEAAVVELIGSPEEQRANRAARGAGLGAGGSDAAQGAAEARRLLGIE